MRRLLWILLAIFVAAVFPPLSAAEAVKVRKVTIPMPDWPAAGKQIRIVLISDLHLTAANISKPLFSELPDKINELKPDLLLIGGDIFHVIMRNGLDFIEKDFQALIARIRRPPLGIIAICGNHDHCVGRNQVVSLLVSAGLAAPPSGTVIPLDTGGGKLYLGTSEAETADGVSEKLKNAMASHSPFLLLAHFPQVFDAVPQELPVVVLAGHTHGGVVRIPGMKDGTFAALFAGHKEKYFYGLYRENKKVMYVTSGIGGEGKSGMRINNPPEIVLLTFQ